MFARHGYAAVSMRQIAAETGVQVGALYNHVADKQSLLAGLMHSHMAELLLALDAVALPDDDPVAALEAFTRFHIRFHSERPDEVFISYMELRNLSPANFAEIEALRGRYEARLGAILEAGAAQGRMHPEDAKLTALAIIAMLTGVTTWFRAGGRLSLVEIEARYWEMVRRLVAA